MSPFFVRYFLVLKLIASGGYAGFKHGSRRKYGGHGWGWL